MGLENSKFMAKAQLKGKDPTMPDWLKNYSMPRLHLVIEELKTTKNFAAIYFIQEQERTLALQYCLTNGLGHKECRFLFSPPESAKKNSSFIAKVTGKLVIENRIIAPKDGDIISCRLDEAGQIWQRWGQKGWLELPDESEPEHAEPEHEAITQKAEVVFSSFPEQTKQKAKGKK